MVVNQQAVSNQRTLGALFSSVRFRIPLIVLGAAIIPLAILIFIGATNFNQSLTTEIDNSLHSLIKSESNSVSDQLSKEVELLQLFSDINAIEQLVTESNDFWSQFSGNVNQEIARRDGLWVDAVSNDNSIPLIENVISESNTAFTQSRKLRDVFPYFREILITDSYGTLVAASDVTANYFQANEAWWKGAWNDGEGQVWIADEIIKDASTGQLSLQIAVPIVIGNSTVGVLRANVDESLIKNDMLDVVIGESGRLLIADNHSHIQVAAHDNDRSVAIPVEFITGEKVAGEFNTLDINGVSTAVETQIISTNGDYPAIDNLNWSVVILQNESELFSPITNTLNAVLLPIVILAIIVVVVGFLVARTLVRPVALLADAAQHIAREKDWSTRVNVDSDDEFGELGRAFNTMTQEIDTLVSSLEQRVAERTKDIQTVIDVTNQIATILDVSRLLQDVVDLTKERFNLYHAHIYILDDDAQSLTLTAGAGHVGRQMVSEHRTIDANNKQSIVAGAARNRRGSIVNDVTSSPNFLAHPLLPDTKSELAVPLIARGRVLGVLDVQGDTAGQFTEETLGVLEILASQIATAISNASLFEIADRTSRHELALSTIDRRLQQATDVDEMLQIVVRELGKALRVQHTAIELSLASNGKNGTNGTHEGVGEDSDV